MYVCDEAVRGPVLWQWLGVSRAADGERSTLKVIEVKVSVYERERERKVGEVHTARESREASAARDIDAALSPRTPPAPCDLATGKPGLRGRETHRSALFASVCAQVHVRAGVKVTLHLCQTLGQRK